MPVKTFLSYLGSQIWAIAEVVPAIASYRLEKRKVYSQAAAAMRKALNRTRMFLKNPDFSNKSELSLISDLWNDASEKVGVVDSHLGMTLEQNLDSGAITNYLYHWVGIKK